MRNSEVINLTGDILSFTSNCFLIKGKNPTLIDAGNDQKILKNLRSEVNQLDKVLITHFHPDHIGLARTLKEEFNPAIYAFNKREWVDELISDEQEIKAGNSTLTALHTPGHEKNHLVFFGEGALFSGDLIFPGGSIGRTDFPGASLKELINSIKRVLEKFRGEIKELYPGHMHPVLENAEENVQASLDMAERYRV